MEGHVPGCQPLLSPVLLTMTRNRFLLFARLPWCNQMRARALAPSVPFKWKLPVRYLPTCWRPRDKCIRSHLRETWNNCITRDISARSGLELSDKFNQFAWEKAVYSLRVEIPDLQTSAVFLSVRLAVLPLNSNPPISPTTVTPLLSPNAKSWLWPFIALQRCVTSGEVMSTATLGPVKDDNPRVKKWEHQPPPPKKKN